MPAQIKLAPDSPIDLHMHTTFSDGRWPAEQLIDYLATEGFQLVAVTDHDRVDKVPTIQALGAAKNLPVLAGVELSTRWHDVMCDLLCYGFDTQNNTLQALTEGVVREQLENTYAVHEELLKRGYRFPKQEEVLKKSDGKLHIAGDNIALLRAHDYATDYHSALNIIKDAGFRSVRMQLVDAVAATHKSGGVSLIAHPGRQDPGFTFYTPELIDQVRAEMPLDGIEVLHPSHSPELVETYLAYTKKHNLLQSTGSDHHALPSRMPIKYRAEISRNLLERVGITVA